MDKVQIDVEEVTVEVPTKYVNLIKKIAEDLYNKDGFETWLASCNPTAGKILYAARAKNSMTQIDLARVSKVREQHISKMENGKEEISPENAEKFASILNIPKDLLLKK